VISPLLEHQPRSDRDDQDQHTGEKMPSPHRVAFHSATVSGKSE